MSASDIPSGGDVIDMAAWCWARAEAEPSVLDTVALEAGPGRWLLVDAEGRVDVLDGDGWRS